MVRQVFEEAGYPPVSVKLGELQLEKMPVGADMDRLQQRLGELGFEILSDQKGRIIEKIKNIIIRQIREGQPDDHHKFSDILSSSLHKDYTWLSKLFSEVEGVTIEKYIINQKIELVKELLAYGELNLSEISYKLGYSSVAHLSAQFSKTTGFTPSAFRKLKDHHRKPLDKI
jgi:AraC-like DNA-binding protein